MDDKMKCRLEDLINKWAYICEIIPYADGYLKDEYLVDLDGRRYIDDLFPELSPVAKEKILLYDKIFISKTIKIEKCIWGTKVEKKRNYNRIKNWYYYRVPITREEWINMPPGID
jgi:hypothetical protein